MPSVTGCPDNRQLQRFRDGLVSDEEAAILEGHLEACSICVGVLRSVSPADPVAAALVGCAAASRFPSEAELAAERLLRRLAMDRHSSTSLPETAAPNNALCSTELPTGAAGTGPYLDAPKLPGEIGRIGPYRVLAKIGEGGMGTVYKAEDPDLGRLVAIKVPRVDRWRLDDSTGRQRFLREARAAAPIRHPHVCPIYSVGEHRAIPYVVMAFVEGQSLAERLAGNRRFENCRQAVELIRQVAEGLSAVHAQGIIHRDLKPGNILLERAGQAVLTDFGLARPEQDTQHLTAEGSLVGTMAYMPPEQATGERELDRRADIYSLGVVLYQLLTGRLPFEGSSTRVLAQILNSSPPRPSHFRADLDPALEAIVCKAMARQPEERYASAEAFAAALTAWIPAAGRASPSASADTAAVPVQPFSGQPSMAATEVQPSPPHRWRRIAASLAGLAAVLLLGYLMYPRNGTLELKVADEGTIYLGGARQFVIPAPYEGRIDLRPGEYQFTLKRGEKELHSEDFTVTSGKTVSIVGPPPRDIPTGDALDDAALVRRPEKLPGVESWTIEPVALPYSSGPLAYCPTGTYLAVTIGRCVGLWDLDQHEWVRKFFGASGGIDRLIWSPKGNMLAALDTSEKGHCWIWEVPSGKLLKPINAKVPQRLAWSLDGKYLALALQAGTIQRWAVGVKGEPTQLEPLPGSGSMLPALAWTAEGELAFSYRSTVRLCAADSEKPDEKPIIAKPEAGDIFDIYDMAWSPDGRFLACAESGKTVRIWERATGKDVGSFRLDGDWGGRAILSWSADGKRVAAQHGGTIRIWGWPADGVGTPLQITAPCSLPMSLSPDGKTMALGGGYREFVQFLDVEKGTPREEAAADRKLLHPKCRLLELVSWSPNGNTLAAGGRGSGTILLSDIPSGEIRLARSTLDGIGCLVWSPDGTMVAGCRYASGSVEIVDAQSLEMRDPVKLDGNVFCAAWISSKGLAAGGATVMIAGIGKDKEIRPLEKPKNYVTSLACSPDGKLLAGYSPPDGVVSVWETGSGKVSKMLQGSRNCRFIAWSADGKLLAGDAEHMWQPGTWEEVHLDRTALDHPGRPNPAELLACKGGRGTLLIDSSGKVVKEIPTGDFYWQGLSGDGKLLAVGDGTVRIWDTEKGMLLGTILMLSSNDWVVLSAEGHFQGSAGVEKELQVIVQTKNGQELLTMAEFSSRYGWKNDPGRVRWPAR
jgi:serine/threonine protein kinase/WD40 repeat protein